MSGAGGWAVVGNDKKKKKPRKKPVNKKRTPIVAPVDFMTKTQQIIYQRLVSLYPQELTCEDLLENAIRLKQDVKIQQIWEAIDSDPLKSLVVEHKNKRYTIKTE